MKSLKQHPRVVHLIKVATVLLTSILSVQTASAASVTLAWDPSPDPVSRYQVYYGTSSGNYTTVTNAGTALTHTVQGLVQGQAYFFAVTAVGTNALESDFSNEINFTVPLPSNAPPTITVIPDQTINEDTSTASLGFTIGDDTTPVSSLTVTRASSDTSLVPTANIVLSGTGANRAVTVTPAPNAFGTAQITLTVSDGDLTGSQAFRVTVNSVNDLPTITAIPNQTIDEDTSTVPLNFVVGDIETAAGNLVISRTSSNTGLIPTANVVLGGSGANRTVTVTPAANQSGTAQITLTVSDGDGVTNQFFTVTVNPVNDIPTITAIPNQTIDEESSTGPLGFTVGDVETGPGGLFITRISSDTVLIPTANIVLGGNGANRTVTVTPATDQFGTAQITLAVSDGSATTNRTFSVTVSPVNDPPTLDALANVNINEGDGAQLIDLSGISSGAANESQTLIVTATSSNTGLIPHPTVTYTSPESTGTIQFTPVAGQGGTATITVSVNDGASTDNLVTRTFTVSVNRLPVVSTITDQVVVAGTTLGPIPFAISDAETAATSLQVSASSSNQALVRDVDIVFAGTGSNRTISIPAQSGQEGTTDITVSVSDGSGTASTTFQVLVKRKPAAPSNLRIAQVLP